VIRSIDIVPSQAPPLYHSSLLSPTARWSLEGVLFRFWDYLNGGHDCCPRRRVMLSETKHLALAQGEILRFRRASAALLPCSSSE
jgi:hypothetical protein